MAYHKVGYLKAADGFKDLDIVGILLYYFGTSKKRCSKQGSICLGH